MGSDQKNKVTCSVAEINFSSRGYALTVQDKVRNSTMQKSLKVAATSPNQEESFEVVWVPFKDGPWSGWRNKSDLGPTGVIISHNWLGTVW